MSAAQFATLSDDLDIAVAFCRDSPHTDYRLWATAFKTAQLTARIIAIQLTREEDNDRNA